MKRRIENLALFFGILFMILAVYLSFIQVIDNERLAQSPQNPRNLEDYEYRGRIFDRSGNLIAYTRKTDSQRVYPEKSLFSPVIGYANRKLGKDGIEKEFNENLAGKRLPRNFREAIKFLQGKKLYGSDLFLTIDRKIQRSATLLMNGYKGAILVLDPRTGEILAMVSQPTFNPNSIESSWKSLKEDPQAPLINRVTSGQYPPGSTFKIFTLAVALQLGYVDETSQFDCPGYYDIGTYRIHEAKGGRHGRVNIEEALVHSCNVAFAQIGLKIGTYSFYEYIKKFKLEEDFSIDLPVKRAHFAKPSELTEGGLAQSAFGQGEITLSVIHIALIASAIANEGKIMKPFLVKGVRSNEGDDLLITRPYVWIQPISKETAEKIKWMMVSAVKRGTGYAARIPQVEVAGKTGTAENPHGEPHSWFVGFAPAKRPKYMAVAILENAGYGGAIAAPIVGRLLEECIKYGNEK